MSEHLDSGLRALVVITLLIVVLAIPAVWVAFFSDHGSETGDRTSAGTFSDEYDATVSPPSVQAVDTPRWDEESSVVSGADKLRRPP